ncbi:MAG: tRNA (adenosine(37)-N6)-threonylcarbamoyltransferase complex ATPase subunit type 1 TsaE [Parcubacteria group bacterium]|jgi:tRNA threonylcarbamoyladenosine biosynthesis protein TsaE
MKTIISTSIAQTHAFARDIIENLPDKTTIICLQGELGSGKTTLAQGILEYCGAEGPYTSPTFTIIKQYDIDAYGKKRVYHIDTYRIGSHDMIELGWQEMISDRQNLIIVEWPERIADILPADAIKISCEWIDEKTRRYIM